MDRRWTRLECEGTGLPKDRRWNRIEMQLERDEKGVGMDHNRWNGMRIVANGLANKRVMGCNWKGLKI